MPAIPRTRVDNMIEVTFYSYDININEFHEWMHTVPTGKWFVGFDTVYFEKPEDITIFKLKWA